uniref:Uncharacterized protein n=1 Tax=Molossus molossus TaxID=27622 RepID=A0A7J8I8M7_MOLMO|nr:hypothetical protein HJG59_010718 [Molossus molossus]
MERKHIYPTTSDYQCSIAIVLSPFGLLKQNKTRKPQTGWLLNKRNLLPTVLDAGSPRSGACTAGRGLPAEVQTPCGGRAREPCGLSRKTLNPTHEAPPSPSKGLTFSHHHLWGEDFNISIWARTQTFRPQQLSMYTMFSHVNYVVSSLSLKKQLNKCLCKNVVEAKTPLKRNG